MSIGSMREVIEYFELFSDRIDVYERITAKLVDKYPYITVCYWMSEDRLGERRN